MYKLQLNGSLKRVLSLEVWNSFEHLRVSTSELFRAQIQSFKTGRSTASGRSGRSKRFNPPVIRKKKTTNNTSILEAQQPYFS